MFVAEIVIPSEARNLLSRSAPLTQPDGRTLRAGVLPAAGSCSQVTFAMIDATTPLMQQYQSIKSRYPHALLLFRLGDFYELFYEDAILTSRELQITLTSRN